MASCSEGCGSGSGGESSGSEVGPDCLQFGVRSYLHHFYEECTASVWEGDPEGRGYVQTRRSPPWWSSGLWKVCLALGVLVLTSGLVCVMVGYSTPPRIQSFGDEELLFVDPQAVSFNRGLRHSVAAGTGLSCLGSGLAVVGLLLWSFSRTGLKEERCQKDVEGERRRERKGGTERERRERREERGTSGGGQADTGEAVTRAPGAGEGKGPVTPSKAENVPPSS